MRPAVRDRLIVAGLALGCYALAIGQRPGTLVADTKINLHTDPGSFLGQVTSAWSSTADLGHVWAGQYGGYLFPMAPWFAGGHALGIPMWLVGRLWLGTLLALAAWGVVRLLDALSDRPRGVPHVAAAVLFVVNPYVAVYANRISVALLAYAALPWMLLFVHRGLRAPRSWAWPAAFALALTCTGGGVNAAVTAWVLVAPALFAIYERLAGGVGRGALRPWLVRMAVANVLASAWWVVPVLVAARYGTDFLPYTEQPGTIWSTTSLTESLRLMGFWTSYVGVGFGGHLYPYAGHGHAFLFHPPVVVASLLVPALALGGFAWTRRWRYGAWFLLLTLVGVMVMSAGFPEGTPLRRGLTFTYNHVQALQFLRTTYKAGPLAALGLACLGGAAFAEAWRRLRGPVPRGALAVAGAGLVALAAWPLTSGRAPERQLALPHGVPAAWKDEAKLLDRRGDGTRAFSLPGQAFSYYRWGGTVDHVLTGLTDHPVATRYIVPFADLRSVDLQWATDALVSQERAVPGQLPPLLSLMGVGDVVLGADGDRGRSGELSAAAAADLLAGQGLLAPGRRGAARGRLAASRCADAPTATCRWRAASGQVAGPRARGVRSFGPDLSVRPPAGRLAVTARLPQVTDILTATPGIVRLLPRGPLTVVDGAAQGLVDLAAFGALPTDRPIAYAADLSPAKLRAAARAGADLVVSDSNRRQAFVAARLRSNRGYVLQPGQDVSANGVILDPFSAARPAAQTVAVLRGVRSISSPFSPQTTQFPEHRPYAAMDGNLATSWIADRFLEPFRHHLDVAFDRPREVPYVDLYPYSDPRGVVTRVVVSGHTFRVHRGWNRLRLGLRRAAGISVEIPFVRRPKHASAGGGGIRELRIPGVRVTERLRSPLVLDRALRGTPLERSSLTYLFSRFVADSPAWTSGVSGAAEAGLLRDRTDPEPELARTIAVPAARRFTVDAWVSVRQRASDSAIDALAGVRGGARVEGSARFEGAPAYRASSALDGDPRTAWIGEWVPGRPAWLGWRTLRPHPLTRVRLVPLRARVRRPTRIRLVVDGASTGPLAVSAGGRVALPPGLRGRDVRIEVLAARFPPGTPAIDRQRRAVAIAEVEGGPRVTVPRRGRRSSACLALLRVDRRPVRLRATFDVSQLDAGRPLRARGCGPPVALPAGGADVLGLPAALVVDQLRLRSPAAIGPLAEPIASTGAGAGRVLSQGEGEGGSRAGARVRVSRPAWLVLGESYNRGWRASCDGRSLGAPTPLQGFANAWPVGPGCRDVSFTFGPDSLLPPFYLLSLVCSVLFALGLVARRRALAAQAVRHPVPAPVPDDAPARWTPGRALAAGVAVALATGFLFALRAGVVAGPAVALLLYLRVPTRMLVGLAFAALAVIVPALYLAHPGRDPGGYSTYFAVAHLAAHWVAVGAVVLLTIALLRTLRAAGVTRRSR